jgi:hypothetical protein
MSGLVHGVLEHIREFPFFSFLIALVAIVPVAIGYIFLRVYTVSSLNVGRDGKQKKTDVWTEDDFDQSLQAERASKDNMTLDDELGLTAKDPRELGGKCDEYDWLQTNDDIVVEVLLPKETRSKDCKVIITSSSLSVNVGEKKIVSGQLLRVLSVLDISQRMWCLVDFIYTLLRDVTHDIVKFALCVVKMVLGGASQWHVTIRHP